METRKELKKFGAILGYGFLFLSLLFIYKETFLGVYLLSLSGLLFITAILVPIWLYPVQKVWLAVGHFMGQIVTGLILAVFFFIILTPVAIIARLFGKEFVKLKMDQKSYWNYCL